MRAHNRGQSTKSTKARTFLNSALKSVNDLKLKAVESLDNLKTTSTNSSQDSPKNSNRQHR